MYSPEQNVSPAKPRRNCCQRFISFLKTDYLTTWKFIFKCVIVILCIGGSIAASWGFNNRLETQYYYSVGIIIIAVELILTLMHICRIMEKIKKVPWSLVEAIINAVLFVLMLVAASICIDYGRRLADMVYYLVSGSFGFAVCVMLILDGIFHLIQWKRS